MKRMGKRAMVLGAGGGLVLIALVLVGMFFPWNGGRLARTVCRVAAHARYELPVGGDTLYLGLRDDSLPDAAVRPEWLAADSVDVTGVFVSNAGHVVTTDSLLQHMPDSIGGLELQRRLLHLDTLLARRSRLAKEELRELDYYASTHSAIDDGYNEVMAYRETVTERSRQTDSTLLLLRKVRALPHAVAVLGASLSVRGGDSRVAEPASVVVRRNGLLLLQLSDGRLPAGAGRMSVYALGTYAGTPSLYAHNDFGGLTATDSVACLRARDERFPATEGGVWVNASGQLCGIERSGVRVSSRQVAALLRREHLWPVWWAVNAWNWAVGLTDGTEVAVKSPQERRSVDENHWISGCARLQLPDSTLYLGQVSSKWTDGRPTRQGYGALYCPDGTVYEGRWQSDSLAEGRKTDTRGCYSGTFDKERLAEGIGVFQGRNGEHYEGQWRAGRREGHGFSSRAGRIVRCGAWKRDRFKGERMVYTADRVYGIDISRHQHERGRKRYGIDWSRLRITSLGGGRRVSGAVDYPVSFVYIKATEGRSLFNRYYPSDLRQARRHGIPVGSYHFFSATSTGAQQAAYFLKMAWVAGGDLPPVLDLEPTDAQVRQMGGRAAMFAQVLVWLRRVERSCGKRPVLYVGQQFVNSHLLHAPAEMRRYDVWIARYGEYKPYVHLLHWQLTPYGRVRGIRGEVDINVFNGTREQFQTYRAAH